MSIKRILVPLPGSAGQHTGQIETAMSVAKALGAHVQALFISEPPPVTRGGLTVAEMGQTATAASVNWHAEERGANCAGCA
ncbi:DNA-binding XRE family transcriptional regulator [Bradyrhizobium sp. LM2.7]